MASYGNKKNANHIPYAPPHPFVIDTDDRIRCQSKGNNDYVDVSPPPRDRYYYDTSDHSDDEDDGIECIDGRVRLKTQKGASPYIGPVETPPRKEPTSCADYNDIFEVRYRYDSPASCTVRAKKDKNTSSNYKPVNNYRYLYDSPLSCTVSAKEDQKTSSNYEPVNNYRYRYDSPPSVGANYPYRYDSPPSVRANYPYCYDSPPSVRANYPYCYDSPPSVRANYPYRYDSPPSCTVLARKDKNTSSNNKPVNNLPPIKTRVETSRGRELPKESPKSFPGTVVMQQPRFNSSPRKETTDSPDRRRKHRGTIESTMAAAKYNGVFIRASIV